MPKRFPRQTFRSYRHQYGKWVDSKEVEDHVFHTWRCDADMIFNEFAHAAATYGLNHCYTGMEGVSFTQPTKNPRGYFAVLQYIIAHPSCTRREIFNAFGAPVMTTIQRLQAGRLVYTETKRSKLTHRLCDHFSPTELGNAYASAGARYLVKRVTDSRYA